METNITKTFTYKLKPSRLVKQVFNQYAGSVRYIYNYMLALLKSSLETENKWLSRAIADVGWGLFLQYLEYKCLWQGKHFVRVNTFLPSSKLCNACGNIQAMPHSSSECTNVAYVR